jgi:hypothetical protein
MSRAKNRTFENTSTMKFEDWMAIKCTRITARYEG